MLVELLHAHEHSMDGAAHAMCGTVNAWHLPTSGTHILWEEAEGVVCQQKIRDASISAATTLTRLAACEPVVICGRSRCTACFRRTAVKVWRPVHFIETMLASVDHASDPSAPHHALLHRSRCSMPLGNSSPSFL